MSRQLRTDTEIITYVRECALNHQAVLGDIEAVLRVTAIEDAEIVLVDAA